MDKYYLLTQIDNLILDLFGVGMRITRLGKYLASKDVREANLELISRRNTDRVYICGLGPSFSRVDLKRIDADTIVTNRFALYDAERIINPTYYCLFDKAFCGESASFTKQAADSYPNAAFVLDGKQRDEYESIFKGTDASRYYVLMWGGRCKETTTIDFTKLIPSMGNVVCGAIALALYCGYKEIVLLGCDFNSFASLKPMHCYDDGDKQKSISLSYELFVYSFVANIHSSLRKLAESKGVRIVNATPGSLIDSYVTDPALMDYLHIA